MESSQAALVPLAEPPSRPLEPSRENNDWPWWTAPAALVGGLLLAAIGGLVVDIPAALFGVSITTSRLPGWLELLDTIVQDGAFIGSAVLFAHVGRRTVRAWQFGLRPPRPRWRSSALLVCALLVSFLIFSAIWAEILDAHTKEKLLEQLGADEGTGLLLLSALLTCVIAPFCEEFLFRGFIYTALCSLRGPWPAAIITGIVFGGIHAGSAPVADLLPLGMLGFGLCLLYRRTGSLYPCIAAHSLNNSLAFGALENWGWQIPVLMLAALATIALVVLALERVGVIVPPPATPASRVVAAAT